MPSRASGDDDGLESGDPAAAGPHIRRMHDYWTGLRGTRKFPAWSDVNLMDVYDVAPYVAVLDVETGAEGAAFRYRFYGTMLVDWRSRLRPADPTGRLVGEIEWSFDPAPMVAAFTRVAVNAAPLVLTPNLLPGRSYHRFVRGVFPLGAADSRVDQILVCLDEVGGG